MNALAALHKVYRPAVCGQRPVLDFLVPLQQLKVLSISRTFWSKTRGTATNVETQSIAEVEKEAGPLKPLSKSKREFLDSAVSPMLHTLPRTCR